MSLQSPVFDDFEYLWAPFIDVFCGLGPHVSFFDCVGALGSDVGVQGRFLVQDVFKIRQKSHPSGSQFRLFW